MCRYWTCRLCGTKIDGCREGSACDDESVCYSCHDDHDCPYCNNPGEPLVPEPKGDPS